MQAFIALIACFSAFLVPIAIIALAVFGFADVAGTSEILKTWFAYIGPFAASIIGYYFKGLQVEAAATKPPAPTTPPPAAPPEQPPAPGRT